MARGPVGSVVAGFCQIISPHRQSGPTSLSLPLFLPTSSPNTHVGKRLLFPLPKKADAPGSLGSAGGGGRVGGTQRVPAARSVLPEVTSHSRPASICRGGREAGLMYAPDLSNHALKLCSCEAAWLPERDGSPRFILLGRWSPCCHYLPQLPSWGRKGRSGSLRNERPCGHHRHRFLKLGADAPLPWWAQLPAGIE